MDPRLGRLERLEGHGITKRITEWKTIAFRPHVGHKIRWEDDVHHDLKLTNFYL